MSLKTIATQPIRGAQIMLRWKFRKMRYWSKLANIYRCTLSFYLAQQDIADHRLKSEPDARFIGWFPSASWG